MKTYYHSLPELDALERCIELLEPFADIQTLAKIKVRDKELPLYALTLGKGDAQSPVLGLFAGVHGLERIGTRIVISYLQTLAELLSWDETVSNLLKKSRLVFIPLINPGGMYLKSRSNPNGIDLMRNAPIEADLNSKLFIAAGHRISKYLPWYRGEENAAMETEAKAVCDFVEKNIFPSSMALTVDFHSGFGKIDRFWFPYAKTKAPVPDVAKIYSLKTLLDRTYPNHVYCVEPQSKQYRTHGDLWDYLYDKHLAKRKKEVFIPFTLELGSWLWVKKNPSQLFSLLGPFNPQQRHRYQRILRRHITLIEFLWKAVLSPKSWVDQSESQELEMKSKAINLWYQD